MSIAALVASSCGGAPANHTPSEEPAAPSSADIGNPLPGLDPAALARFEAGRALFRRRFAPEDGLGPRFNEDACNACHTDPADGGTGEQLVLKASRWTDGRCDPLARLGGENLRSRVIPDFAARGGTRVPVPEEATHRARFTVPFLFGLGLLDAVAQQELDAMADPDDADGDGISGRVGRDAAGRPARFGRKADVATLADFVDSAFRLEMGLTTHASPDESLAGALPGIPDDVDTVVEPEVDAAALARVTDFLRFLAAPAPATLPEADGRDVERGRALFAELGCVSCHVPTLRAAPGSEPALSGRVISAYSDLLLHDMGPGLEGTCTTGASPTEYRTEPLLGLRYRRAFLHDGRVGRVIDAILAHGGEAARARDAFAALDRVTQELVLTFLGTL